MNLRDTIKPKSDQLNYDDVASSTKTLTVKTLKSGDDQQPVWIIPEENEQPYKPSKSMRRVIIAAWGDKGKDWIGKSMVIYGEPSIKFGGVEVGGIRISHMSGIDNPVTVKLTVSRGKRIDFVVYPITEAQQ